jgi:hypothetical protein
VKRGVAARRDSQRMGERSKRARGH